MKNVLAIAALSALLCGSVSYAVAADGPYSDYDPHYLHDVLKLPDGFTAAQLFHALAEDAKADERRTDGLQSGWKESDLCASQNSARVRLLRNEDNLLPGFSEADFRRAEAASRLRDLTARLDLPEHFDEQQLVKAEALKDLAYKRQDYPGLPLPFSAEQLAAAAGKQDLDDLEVKFALPAGFDYAAFKSIVGPEEAASESRQYGFERGDSHEQMAARAGAQAAARYADYKHLSADFTAAQLMDRLVAESLAYWRDRLQEFMPTGTPLNDVTVGEYYADLAVRDDRSWHHTTEVSEAGLMAAECTSTRDTYDLEPGFTEDDYGEAVAASRIATLRRLHHLPSDFTEGQLKAAVKDGGNSYRPDYFWYGR